MRAGPLLVAAVAALAAGASGRAAEAPLRIATLTPDESLWGRLLHEWADAVAARTPVRITFLANGAAGSEREYVPKLRAGELDGATLSTVGIGALVPSLRVLDLPLLFRSDEELDAVRAALADELDRQFAAAGLVRVAWGDVGGTYLLARTPIAATGDFAALTHWSWDADPIGDALLRRLGSHGRSVDVPDLVPAVLRGEITALLSSPLTAVAMQLYRGLRYISAAPVMRTSGAIVIRKASWDRLTPATQRALREEGRRLETRLLRLTRQNDAAAMRNLVDAGLVAVALPEPALTTAARATRTEFDDKLYPKAFRLRVERAVAEARKAK